MDMQSTGVLLLAEEMYFGRDELAAERSPLLWPVLGRAALVFVLDALADQGVGEVTVCTDEPEPTWVEVAEGYPRMRVRVQQEELALGSAGHLREAMRSAEAKGIGRWVILPATMTCPPQVEALVAEHERRGGALTVIRDPEGRSAGRMPEMFICERDVAVQIPASGYADIKEGLIAALLRAGKDVRTFVLDRSVGDFRTWPEYVQAVADCISEVGRWTERFERQEGFAGGEVWTAPGVTIPERARVLGPAVLQEGVQIEPEAVVVGPVVAERNVRIGRGSVVAQSVLWERARVEEGAAVRRCVCVEGSRVADAATMEDAVVVRARKHGLRHRGGEQPVGELKPIAWLRAAAQSIGRRYPVLEAASRPSWLGPAVWLAIVAAAFAWCYWPTLRDMWVIWLKSDEYSSGLLVPFLAGYVLWARRASLAEVPIRPSVWGLAALVGAQAFRLYGLYANLGSFERLSTVLTIGALALWVLGWPMIRRTWTVLLFLFLMVPWPNSLREMVTLPMQRYATSSAVFCLEMLGYLVVREGNILHVGGTTVGVEEACNGLRMVMAFWVVGGLVVLLIERPLWQKVTVLVSCLPVALVCNTIRLTLTTVLFTWVQSERLAELVHDLGGYAMMPLALGMVMAEFWLLRALTTPPEGAEARMEAAR